MPAYKNVSGKSGVASYEIYEDAIVVTFHAGGPYLYNNEAPGKALVEEIKRLAEAGEGLNTFINQHVKKNYAKKL